MYPSMDYEQKSVPPPPSAPYYPVAPPATGVPVSLAPMAEKPWSTGLCCCCEDISNSCLANGAMHALLMYFTGCGCLMSCFYRTKMRNPYMLKDNASGDCCLHFFCEGCALCQEYRELKNRGFDMAPRLAGEC